MGSLTNTVQCNDMVLQMYSGHDINLDSVSVFQCFSVLKCILAMTSVLIVFHLRFRTVTQAAVGGGADCPTKVG